MSKPLSVASIIEKNRLSSEIPFLICLDVDVIDPATGSLVETLHIVRNSEPITFNGHDYTPASFDIELREEAGTQQTIKVSINDYSKDVQARLQQYGGGVGFNVAIMVVNAGNLSQPPEVLENFQVVASETANYVCSFTLGAENTLTKVYPRRRQMRDFCQYRYKGKDCQYVGANPTCDLSLEGPNGCKAHDNVVHFGGFPGIVSRDINYG